MKRVAPGESRVERKDACQEMRLSHCCNTTNNIGEKLERFSSLLPSIVTCCLLAIFLQCGTRASKTAAHSLPDLCLRSPTRNESQAHQENHILQQSRSLCVQASTPRGRCSINFHSLVVGSDQSRSSTNGISEALLIFDILSTQFVIRAVSRQIVPITSREALNSSLTESHSLTAPASKQT